MSKYRLEFEAIANDLPVEPQFRLRIFPLDYEGQTAICFNLDKRALLIALKDMNLDLRAEYIAVNSRPGYPFVVHEWELSPELAAKYGFRKE